MKTVKRHMYMVVKAGVMGVFCKHFRGFYAGFKAMFYAGKEYLRDYIDFGFTKSSFMFSYDE